MAETINSILQLRSLEEDWDLDGAQPIAELAIDHATRFVGLVDEMAEQAGLSWQDPVTGPVADGSVALTWDTGARQTLTIFRPQQLPLVVCVTRERGGRSTRQVVSPEDAAQQVLWAWDPDGK